MHPDRLYPPVAASRAWHVFYLQKEARWLIGIVAALFTLRLTGGMLYGVSGTEPSVVLGAAGLLAIVAAVASIVPAWRTTRVDPVRALKAQ